ncbi:MAG: AI-2E family transporter [Bacteroidales bacterium]|nr:AI-2E family transporter [Bacteroidales bacterium]
MLKTVIDKELKIPFYAKTTICFVGLFALISMLYITQFIVVPLVFAIIIAIVLSPIVDFFVRKKIHRNLSIVLAIFIAFLLIAGLGALIVSQVSQLSDSWPALVDKFTAVLNQSIGSISGYLDVDPKNIHEWIAKTKNELINTSGSALGQTIISVGSGLAVVFLIPVYVFLLIYYQPILLEFIHRVSGKNNQVQVGAVVTQTKTVVQRYLIGLLIEAALVGLLDITALLMLGIDYAILIGVIGALLNVIPYIGGIVAVALPMAIALATKASPIYALYVLAAYYAIQLVDNHYFVPIIVASKVKINALFSIIVVLAGNALWGIPGMFLSIPLLAIVKLVFDNIEPLKPWGFLLGDTMPPLIKLKPVFRRKKKG